MKKIQILLLFACMMGSNVQAQSNAAPSQHLTYYFPTNAVAQMQKIQITQSAYASYFEINSFTNGYAGLQQTPDSSHGSSHTLISSLWDPNTAGGIYSTLNYAAPNTYTGRFGGEGDGWQTINPYNWVLNRWYNLVQRCWVSNGQLYIATFINDLTSQAWFHTATLSIPNPGNYLGYANDAFLENWDGSNAAWDGRYIRKAYFKDAWTLTAAGVWNKSTSRNFSANANDSARNGIYNNAFNAGYDTTLNAYFMQHGGSTTPASAFNGGRTLSLPAQSNQGTSPTLTTGSISSVTASYSGGKVYVNWTNDASKSPQLAATVQITNSTGAVVIAYTDTVPQRRIDTLTSTLSAGTYTANVFFTDIFNQTSNTATTSFTVSAGSQTYWYSFKNASSGKYLSVKNSSTANSANIVQYAALNNAAEWTLKTLSGGATVLINRNSSKAIDLPGSNQNLGTDPIQYTESDNVNQQWNLISVGTGKYLIQSNMSNHYVLDDSASSTTDGTNIILYAANGTTGSSNQQWVMQLVDSTSIGTTAVKFTNTGYTAEASADSNSTAGEINVYPNPVSNTLHVYLPKAKYGKNVVLIYSLDGKCIYRYETDKNTADINVSSLSRSTYLLSVNGTTRKFIKQ